MGEDIKPSRFQSRLQIFQQKGILERASREANAVQVRLTSKLPGEAGKNFHKPTMKSGADLRRSNAALEVLDHGIEQRTRLYDPAILCAPQVKWIGITAIERIRKIHFQFDGGLTFIGNFLANTG